MMAGTGRCRLGISSAMEADAGIREDRTKGQRAMDSEEDKV